MPKGKITGNLFEDLAKQQQEQSSEPIPLIEPLPNHRIPLDDIKDRAEDTRSLNLDHVSALSESIAVLGLIEPLAVDKNNVLLAGGHRKAAIALLQVENPDAYKEHFGSGIPVRVMNFDAEEEPDRALQIEIAENEQRRDYTPTEVRAIADRLKIAGFAELKGRPKKGEKPLMPALSVVVGKSIRTIQNYLKEEENKESTKDFALSETYIKRAISTLKKWEKVRGRKRWEVELSKELPDILAKLERVIEGK